jgi:hypothetical protein
VDSSAANAIVSAAAGTACGSLTTVMMLMLPASYGRATTAREGESFLDTVRRANVEQHEIMERTLAESLSFRLVSLSLGALAVVIALAVWLSPVTLHWKVFIAAILVGVLAIQGLYHGARLGRVRVGGGSRLDRLDADPAAIIGRAVAERRADAAAAG